MHLTPPVTAEGYGGFHHPRYTDCLFSNLQDDVISDNHSNRVTDCQIPPHYLNAQNYTRPVSLGLQRESAMLCEKGA